jgi:predicted lysophospholipase L1 biosynthesis ABC-type transport system permease subunit
MRHFWFYLTYALRNLWRSRRWSSFAIFSVAAGVATMVALRSLGLSIGDSLTGDIRASLKGDISVEVGGARFFSALTDADDDDLNFPERTLVQARDWAASQDIELSEYRVVSGFQLTKLDAVTVGRLQFINALFIDAATYPPTDDILAEDPAGIPLNLLFTGEGDEVVISRNLADQDGIAVGDTVRVSGSETLFTVRGIVPTATEAGFSQLFSGDVLGVIFGFAYFDQSALGASIQANDGINRISVRLPGFPDDLAIRRAESQLAYVLGVKRGSGWYKYRSVPEERETLSIVSDFLGRFIVVLGLGAMLLGGVGIINTMLVLVRRRTEEIAALKTFGLRGRQIAAMFLAEAFWLGVFGSLLGGVFGVLLSVVANRFGADIIQQPLTWRFYPDAVLFGAALGVIVSTVFGVLPVLSAARVRPAIILRPTEAVRLNAGCLTSGLALLFVVLSLGLIAGQIIGVWWVGVAGVAVTLLILGILCILLWLLVWVVGKLPSFGSIDLRLALRNLSTRRLRTAITLLALSSGMFALSSIAFFGESAREILQFTLRDTLGGNVLVFPVLPQELANPLVDARLNSLEGVEYRTRIYNYRGYPELVNGEQLSGGFDGGPNSEGFGRDTIIVRDTTDPNYAIAGITQGRSLTAEDRGKSVAVFTRQQDPFEDGPILELKVGDIVDLRVNGMGRTVQVEIVGVVDGGSSGSFGGGFNGALSMPPGVLPTGASGFALTLVQAQPEKLNEVLLGLSSIPLVLTFDISFFDGILNRFITQFSALPLLVGLLSLGAAAVITANTVALATLERRRQMGILKAIGLKQGRVLRILLLENVLVSLLGAVIGIGLSALGVWIMTSVGLASAVLIPRNSLIIAVILVAAATAIGVGATLASASVAVRERVMNVLRYE